MNYWLGAHLGLSTEAPSSPPHGPSYCLYNIKAGLPDWNIPRVKVEARDLYGPVLEVRVLLSLQSIDQNK